MENMELKLDHICGYFPYGLKKIQSSLGLLKGPLISEVHTGNYHSILDNNWEVKPILIPLDRLTHEQKDHLFDNFSFKIELGILAYSGWASLSRIEGCLKYLYSIKADIFGLIEQGLAIDAYALETNPYQ